jgi:hypothetical protein
VFALFLNQSSPNSPYPENRDALRRTGQPYRVFQQNRPRLEDSAGHAMHSGLPKCDSPGERPRGLSGLRDRWRQAFRPHGLSRRSRPLVLRDLPNAPLRGFDAHYGAGCCPQIPISLPRTSSGFEKKGRSPVLTSPGRRTLKQPTTGLPEAGLSKVASSWPGWIYCHGVPIPPGNRLGYFMD